MKVQATVVHRIGLLSLFLLALIAHAEATPVSYDVSVNTNAISGSSGYLSFQFNPGGADAPSATATIGDFASIGGTLSVMSNNSGGASGTLPLTVTINNSDQLNELFQGFTFGSSFSFQLTFAGPAIESPSGTSSGSAFALSLYASDEQTPLLTIDPNGTVLTILITPNGDRTVQTFPADDRGSPPTVTIAERIAAVPEPATLWLFAMGAFGLGLAKRRIL